MASTHRIFLLYQTEFSTMPHILIGVMGPGEGASPILEQQAYALGYEIAQQGWVLLTGGRNVGVMEAASRGARAAKGLVVGILPGGDRTQMSAAVDIAIVTDLGNARNALNVLSSQVMIALPGGAGTLSEVALALKAKRPVVLLGWDPADRPWISRFSPPGAAVVWVETPAAAIAQVAAFLKP
jgi:uncharacterized protein (TIGR00725 family)